MDRRLTDYLSALNEQYRTDRATEHSYRAALQSLLGDLLPHLLVVNEPRRGSCGAPDFSVSERRRGNRLIGIVETKNVGDADLDGRREHREQFARYKASYRNCVFTDYLDFHFYEHDKLYATVRLAEVREGRIVAIEGAAAKFLELVHRFGESLPQTITSASDLACRMAAKARLLAVAVRETLARDADGRSSLAGQLAAFRRYLIHDITAETFADVYAQTITYGLFAARLNDDTPDDFSTGEAAELIPASNPFLRTLFQSLAFATDPSIKWIIDDLVSVFAASDVKGILRGYGHATAQTDPILHFYEDFLAAYDPALRKARGVWYTPLPVVGFIVRAVDFILERIFGLSGGLANSDKVKVSVKNDDAQRRRDAATVTREMHRVQILDPATGTGTFLAETIRRIHAKFAGMEGVWPNYVSEHLLPRLNGFEVLMASYAMAHLKLGLLLNDTLAASNAQSIGRLDPLQRLRVYLTNSLEEFAPETGTLFAAALGDEANEANFIKRDCPVMCVVGNPPYSGVSCNNGEWITRLIGDYKKEPGSELPLDERKHWLNDDYVKFLRFAQHCVEKNGEGVVGFINNNGFLDNPTFRGMRWSLLTAFDEIYIVNLHGNAKKMETSPDGGKDENVFDITQGVSINIFVKRGGARKAPDSHAEAQRRREKNQPGRPLATVRYCDVYGRRAAKYAWLDVHALDAIDWQTVELKKPFYFFTPQNEEGRDEYEKGFRLDELIPVQSMGVVSANDSLNVSFTEDEQRRKIAELLELPEDEWRRKTGRAKDSRDWTYVTARSDAVTHPDSFDRIVYRPFDIRFTCYTGQSRGLYSSPQHNVMRQFRDGENLGFCAIKINSRDNGSAIFVTSGITDKTILSSKDNANVFPLYVYHEEMGRKVREVNFDKAIYARLCASLHMDASSLCCERVFHYIYAVLHTPSYRARYREFLKVDFPRIPYPTDAALFARLADIGAQLVEAHLLRAPKVRDIFSPLARFPVAGDNMVERVCLDEGRVSINPTQYFDNVPEEVFNFHIGGYQPAQKWLKDRKGRALAFDDIAHYRSIVLALAETHRLMNELEMIAQEEMR